MAPPSIPDIDNWRFTVGQLLDSLRIHKDECRASDGCDICRVIASRTEFQPGVKPTQEQVDRWMSTMMSNPAIFEMMARRYYPEKVKEMGRRGVAFGDGS